MALIELNIYNDENEIVKTFSANRVRWGVIVKAVELQEKTENATEKESIELVSDLMFSIFPSMTPEDLAQVDYNDMFNVFRMIVNMTGHIEKNG